MIFNDGKMPVGNGSSGGLTAEQVAALMAMSQSGLLDSIGNIIADKIRGIPVGSRESGLADGSAESEESLRDLAKVVALNRTHFDWCAIG